MSERLSPANQQPGIKSPESTEGERSALKKLKVLQESDFKDYAVRFTSLEEYIIMLKEKSFIPGQEVFLPHQSFRKFKSGGIPDQEKNSRSIWGKISWGHIASEVTDWHLQTANVKDERDLLIELKNSRGDEQFKTRSERLLSWREVILKSSFDVTNPLSKIHRLKEEVQHRLKHKQPLENIEGFKPEEILMMKQFIEEPQWIVGKGNLRKFVRMVVGLGGESQYKVAAIFALPAVNMGDRYGYGNWRMITQEAIPDPAQQFLGCIVIVTDKEIVRKVIGISAQAQGWSHPVFNNRSEVVYPHPASTVLS